MSAAAMSRDIDVAQVRDVARRRARGDEISVADAGIEARALTSLAVADEANPRHEMLRRCADIRREPLRWLWAGRLPLGKVSMLVGDPGLGKSLVTLGIAATVSRGCRWPIRGEGQAPVGDVALVSAEDDPADTIRPRLEAAGADLNRVHVLDGIEEVNEQRDRVRRPWTMGDLPELERLLERLPDCKLLVIDPVSAYLAGTDSHKNADIRALLAPLSDIAARYRLAVLCVSHLNKSQGPAIYRTTGSLAFVAAARAVYAITKDKDDPARRLVVPVKANLAPDATGLAYRIGTDATGTPRLEWEPNGFPVDANEVLSVTVADPVERTERAEAAEWLRGLLKDGPKRVKEIIAEARGSFSERTLQRARCDIGAKVEREGFGGECWWTMLAIPATISPSQNPGENGKYGENALNSGFGGEPTHHSLHTRQASGTGENDATDPDIGNAVEAFEPSEAETVEGEL